MDANYTTYIYTVTVNVDDDTGEAKAHVSSEAGYLDSVKAGDIDTVLAAQIGAIIALRLYREHWEPEPDEEDEHGAVKALKAMKEVSAPQIHIDDEMVKTIGYALDLAYAEEKGYLDNGDPTVDYGDEWPSIRLTRKQQCLDVAALAERLGIAGEKERWMRLASEFEAETY